ncbi:MAG: hypothetical protein HC886_17565 [Leptolyngbyaceae cyanobacterium SM1_1_3]|nr:hypothetical protein [Leptolyngbyaceae cyanobacterium SM1_1_3]NJN03791.1 hypothetical protein [Leptolyngbyaceae cyanobacterium RM1_1_2]NJO11111.1 hypothetical protein [Leptolyngbyaceae cyanobacterium SL_1_1]
MPKTVWLTIDWRDPNEDIPAAQQEAYTEILFRELNSFDEVERVERLADPNVPEDGVGADWLWGILTAEVTVENIHKLAQAVQERLPGKPIEFVVASGDKTISAKNVRLDDLDATLDKLVAAARELDQ